MAGTVVTTVSQVNYSQSGEAKFAKKISMAWTADASDGSVPATSVELNGWCVKVVTNPGSPAPTANYDIAVYDPDDGGLDAFGGKLIDRHTTNGEQVYPAIGTTPTVPLFCAGTYSMAITGNSVNSATGLIVFYLVDNL